MLKNLPEHQVEGQCIPIGVHYTTHPHLLLEGPLDASHQQGTTLHTLSTSNKWPDGTDDHYNLSLVLLLVLRLVCCHFAPNKSISAHTYWWVVDGVRRFVTDDHQQGVGNLYITYSPPTLTSVGHQWTIPTNRSHFKNWFSQWEPLVATSAGTHRSMMAHTRQCGWAITVHPLYMLHL